MDASYWHKKYENATLENIDRLTNDLNTTSIDDAWWGSVELSKLYGSLTNAADYLIRRKDPRITESQAKEFITARHIMADKITQMHEKKIWLGY